MTVVVLDTNVLVSVFIFPSRGIAILKDMAEAKTIIPAFSEATIAELSGVLRRERLTRTYGYTPIQASAYIAKLCALGITVEESTPIIGESPDPKDDMILSTAWAARAKLIVTGDKKLRSISPWRGIQIVSPADLIARLA